MSPSKCADRPNMSHIITLGGTERPKLSGVRRYEEFTSGMKTFSSMAALESSQVPEPTDIVSFQFTSGKFHCIHLYQVIRIPLIFG